MKGIQMNCNHEQVKTPYCPNCGNPVTRDPLETLLDHVELYASRLKKKSAWLYARRDECLAGSDDYDYWHNRAYAAYSKLGKWEAWRAALERVV